MENSLMNTYGATTVITKGNGCYLYDDNNKEYIDYNTLKKVIETESAFYLYINKSKVLIVDKTVLNKDEIEYLINIFKENVTTYKYKK